MKSWDARSDQRDGVDTPYPDPWDDPHDIEYWVWDGNELAPASASERAILQEDERIRSARRRLARWQRDQSNIARPRWSLASLVRALVSLWHVRRLGGTGRG